MSEFLKNYHKYYFVFLLSFMSLALCFYCCLNSNVFTFMTNCDALYNPMMRAVKEIKHKGSESVIVMKKPDGSK